MKKITYLLISILSLLLICGCAENVPRGANGETLPAAAAPLSSDTEPADTVPADTEPEETLSPKLQDFYTRLKTQEDIGQAFAAFSFEPAENGYCASEIINMLNAKQTVFTSEVKGCENTRLATFNRSDLTVWDHDSGSKSGKDIINHLVTQNLQLEVYNVRTVLVTPLDGDVPLYCISVPVFVEGSAEMRFVTIAVVEDRSYMLDAEFKGASTENAVNEKTGADGIAELLRNGKAVRLSDLILPEGSLTEISTMLADTAAGKNVPLLEADVEYYKQQLGDGTGKKVAAEIIIRCKENGVLTVTTLDVYMPDDLIEECIEVNKDLVATAAGFMEKHGDDAVIYKVHKEQRAILKAIDNDAWDAFVDATRVLVFDPNDN